MTAYLIKKRLNNGINEINIPSKEKLLPFGVPEKEYPVKKNISRIYFKKLSFAAAAVVLVVSIVLGINNINFNGITPTPTPIVDTRPVIYATDSNNLPGGFDNSSIYEGANGISESLKQKMEQYEGQDVLFSVYVRFPRLKEYNNFVRSDEAAKRLNELYAKAEPFEKQIVELQKIYPYGPTIDPNVPSDTKLLKEEWERLYPHLDDLTEEKIADIKRQIDELDAKRKPFYAEIIKIYREEEILEQEQFSTNWQREVEAVKEMSGDKTIRKFTEHSEIAKNSLTSTYILELTADTINKIAERGTTSIYLALPERQGEYSKKISDTLTYYLEQMDEDDTIEIAAVSVLDIGNSYAWKQNLTRNESYNEENFKPWPIKTKKTYTYEEFNKEVDNYINEIMVRNNIADKRIIHDKLPWLGFEKLPWVDDTFIMSPSEDGSYITSGFNAQLTKSEILSLVNEEEIKTLYFVGNFDFALPGGDDNS